MSAPARRTRRERFLDAPQTLDFFELLRELERSAPGKPRIGESTTMAQEIVLPRQNPFMSFPDTNVTDVAFPAGKPAEVFCRFMGMFGPMGPLPLTTTHEASQWIRQRRDPAFARFADLFAARFVQLFYRAWADSRPLVQHGRPEADRFRAWLGSTMGRGTPASEGRDSVGQDTRLFMAGLLAGRVDSGARLLQALRLLLEVPVDIDERIGSWLEFEPGDRSTLGGPRAGLGTTCFLGARVFSVMHKLRVVLHCRDRAEYERFLPGGRRCQQLVDFLHSHLGPTLAVDIALTLPEPLLPATRLGEVGQLGWTSFVSPPAPQPGSDRRVQGAVFSAEFLRGAGKDRANVH